MDGDRVGGGAGEQAAKAAVMTNEANDGRPHAG
jgi:hypothetical protein